MLGIPEIISLITMMTMLNSNHAISLMRLSFCWDVSREDCNDDFATIVMSTFNVLGVKFGFMGENCTSLS